MALGLPAEYFFFGTCSPLYSSDVEFIVTWMRLLSKAEDDDDDRAKKFMKIRTNFYWRIFLWG